MSAPAENSSSFTFFTKKDLGMVHGHTHTHTHTLSQTQRHALANAADRRRPGQRADSPRSAPNRTDGPTGSEALSGFRSLGWIRGRVEGDQCRRGFVSPRVSPRVPPRVSPAFSPRVEAEEKCKFSTGQLPPGPPPCLRATSSADQRRREAPSPPPGEETEEDGAKETQVRGYLGGGGSLF